jgi:hypothetical protein
VAAKSKTAAQQPVVKKKIKPYPFEGMIDYAGQKKPISVLFVNKEGLIANVTGVFVRVGEHYKLQFEVPVIARSVLTDARVMKTYDRALDAKGSKVERMAEFRFAKLSEDHKEYISTFIATIGQNK